MTEPLSHEALAELLPGLAHDVNTPAQYVGDNVSFLRRTFEKLLPLVEAHGALVDALRAGADTQAPLEAVDRARAAARLDYLQRQAPRAIEQALHGLAQINATMRALKELSRPSHPRPAPTDLHELVEVVTTLTRNEWVYVAELELDFDWSLPAVIALRQELSRLLQDAIVNAARSIAATLPPSSADKGQLRITTRRVADSAELVLRGGPAALTLALPLAVSKS